MLLLSVEWVWGVSLWVWLRPVRHSFALTLLSVSYLFSLTYNVYTFGVLAVFSDPPNLYNDITALLSSAGPLARNLGIPFYWYLLTVVGLLLLGLLCVMLLRQLLLASDALKRPSRIALLVLCGLTVPLASAFLFNTPRPLYLSHTVAVKLVRNLTHSAASRQQVLLIEQTGPQLQAAYDYNGSVWREKPDVYVIALESYGDALLQWDEIRPKYTQRLTTLDQTLADADWHRATTRSNAPIRGGKSWLSYTTLLFGLKINSDSQYEALRDYFQSADYPHLGNTFRAQGYASWRYTPLHIEASDEQLVHSTQNLNNYDHWLTLKDSEPFDGWRYGWGPTPPDQYSLWFLREQAQQKTPNQPRLHFMITHNSHRPWGDQPPLVADWHMLNNPIGNAPFIGTRGGQHSKDGYWSAIDYQLRMVVDFIVKGPDNAVYVVIGDHQPPFIAFDDYEGAATPLHIIAKNKTLVAQFVKAGFSIGLTPSLTNKTINHEGFYSLFMQQWLATYATNTQPAPSVCPNGLIFTHTLSTDSCTIKVETSP
ncbi:MAG: hypothetical protein ACPG8W_11115 [Candidatus Promineifilaceae bacterium]